MSERVELTAEHIAVGKLIWYSGETSMSAWSCPALIYEVDEGNRTFKVQSLDDLKKQTQTYTFEVNERSPTSRRTMHLVEDKVVHDYLLLRKRDVERRIQSLKDDIFTQEGLLLDLNAMLLASS